MPYHLFIIFADNVEACHDTWILGDEFLRDSLATINSLKKATSSKLYLHQMFNIKTYYPAYESRGIVRYINSLIDGMNERKNLPKYIIIVPDKDFLVNILNGSVDPTSLNIGAVVHFTIRQIDQAIDRRKMDSENKKPGLMTKDHPKVIWVRMPKRPKLNLPEFSTTGKAFALRGEFNHILEERLCDAKNNHHIMSVVIRKEEFNSWGNLINN